MKQASFASAEYAGKKRKTRREWFLAEMNAVAGVWPWLRNPPPERGPRGRPAAKSLPPK